jgi:hypothetical protein
VNRKYIGEAVALLGIAYSIMRWVARTSAELDAPPPPPIEPPPDKDPPLR